MLTFVEFVAYLLFIVTTRQHLMILVAAIIILPKVNITVLAKMAIVTNNGNTGDNKYQWEQE